MKTTKNKTTSGTRTTTPPALDISDNLSRDDDDDDDDLSYDDSVESEEGDDKFDSTPTSIISKRNRRRDAVHSKRVTINSLKGSKSLQKAILQRHITNGAEGLLRLGNDEAVKDWA